MFFIAIYFLLITIIFFKITKIGLYSSGENAHPFFLVIYFKLFISCVPVIFLAFNDNIETILSSNDYGVRKDILTEGSFYIIISVIILLFVIFLFRSTFGKLYLNYHTHDIKDFYWTKFSLVLISIQLIWLFTLIIQGDAKPLYYLLSGDALSANSYKAMLIRGEVGSKIPVLSYLPKYLFIFCPLFFYNLKINDNKFKIYFYFSFFISLFYFLMSGHKAPIFLFLMFFFFIKYRSSKIKVYKHIPIFILFVISCSYLYLASFNYLDSYGKIEYGISQFLERVFVSQSQGLFYILEYIEPDFTYAYNWIPFSSLFIDNVQTADADVVKLLFPDSQSYVNMNTLFIAEAYSVFGVLGIFFSSFFVWSLILLMAYKFRDFSNRNSFFFVPLSYSFFINLPISQNFSFFISPKEIIVFSAFFYLLYLTFLYLIKKKS